MNCLICRDLQRAYEAALGEYMEARSSVGSEARACIAACATVASLPEAVHVYEREASLK